MIDPRRIWSSTQLPSLPSVALRLLELSRIPDVDIRTVVDVIKADPAISAKILKAANSSYFGFRGEAASLERAVALLGTTVVISLALSFSLTEASTVRGRMAEHYRDYWLQSLVQASAAELFGRTSGEGVECEHFLSGLLIDIGRLAMLKSVPDEYCAIVDAVEQRQAPLVDVERELIGVDHAEVGVKLMESWAMAPALVEAVRLHHAAPDEFRGDGKGAASVLARAMAVAGAVGDYFCLPAKGLSLERLRTLTAALQGFTEEQLQQFLDETKARIEQIGDILSINTDSLVHPSDLMAAANEQLAQMTMREHLARAKATERQQEVEKEKQSLENQNQELQQRAHFDPLTNVYNRRFFDETLAKEISRCCRTAQAVGLILLDVDHFKKLNDTYGHQFGDEVLVRLATCFNQTIRNSDVLARYGGEEFVIVVHQPTEKGIEKLAERIRSRVEQEELYSGSARVPVTVSVGAAISLPGRQEADLAKQLVSAADACLYESKRGGRNRCTVRSLLAAVDRHLLNQTVQRRFSRWLVNRQVLDLPAASRAVLECQTEHVRLGGLAQQHGLLVAGQIEQVVKEQRRTGDRFGQIAVALGFLTESQLVQLLAWQQENPYAMARAVVQIGLLEPRTAAEKLAQYLAESSLEPAGVPAGSSP